MSARRLGERGATALEFAIIAPVVLVFGLIIAELGYQAGVASALDFGARNAGRLGITGTAGTNGVIADASTRQAALRSAVLNASGGLLWDSRLTISQKSYDNITDATADANGASGAGGGSQFVRYNLSYVQPLLFGSMINSFLKTPLDVSSFTYTSTILVTNETFPTN